MKNEHIEASILTILRGGKELTQEEIIERLGVYGLKICTWSQEPYHGRIDRMRFVEVLKSLVDAGRIQYLQMEPARVNPPAFHIVTEVSP